MLRSSHESYRALEFIGSSVTQDREQQVMQPGHHVHGVTGQGVAVAVRQPGSGVDLRRHLGGAQFGAEQDLFGDDPQSLFSSPREGAGQADTFPRSSGTADMKVMPGSLARPRRRECSARTREGETA